MTDYYASTVAGAGGTGSGLSWANACLTISAAMALATADGDRVLVDSAHNETVSSGAYAINAATAGQRISVISVNRNGSTTTGFSAYLAGGTVTGANVGPITVVSTNSCKMFMYGIVLKTNSGSNGNNTIGIVGPSSSANCNVTFVNCTFTVQSNQGGFSIGSGSNAQDIAHGVNFYGCSFVLVPSASRNGIVIAFANVLFANMSVSFFGASKPAALFALNGLASYPIVTVLDSDLSGYANASGFYVTTALFRGQLTIKNCKLDSSTGITDSGTWSNDSNYINFINCDSGNTQNLYRYQTSLGTITNNTSIYANDGQTVNAVHNSWKVVTTSLCSEHAPFYTPWNWRFWGSTSSTTASYELNMDSASNLTDLDIWMEFDYVSNASFPSGTFVSTRNSQPLNGSGSNLSAGAATWTGTGGFTNPNPQKISSTFTPAQAGLMIAGRLAITKASTTLYYDPRIRLV